MRQLFIVNTLTIPLLFVGGIASAADEAATDYWVRVMPAAWFAGFSGEASYSANILKGDNLQLDEVGLDNQEAGFGLEVSAKLPLLVCLHAGGFVMGTDGSFTATGQNFGGQPFAGSVDTALDVSDLFIEADLRPLDLDLVGFAIGLGYHAMNTKVSLSSSGAAAKLDEDFQFPVVALRGHVNLPFMPSLGAEAKVHWMDISLQDNHVGYLDASIQITWRPWEYLGFIGGYRQVAVDVSFDKPAGVNADADVDISLSGPFLGLIGKF
jgi:hypothetical protein